MFNPFPTDEPDLDNAIATVYTDLTKFSANEEGYRDAVDQLTKLYAIKNQMGMHYHEVETKNFEQSQAQLPFYERIDPNTVVTVLGNIFIGLAVIKYEQTGVISSKVMSFMRKI